jgi:hypothetical protein
MLFDKWRDVAAARGTREPAPDLTILYIYDDSTYSFAFDIFIGPIGANHRAIPIVSHMLV